MADLPGRVASHPRVSNARRIVVAWSGGRDSTALLHAALAAARPDQRVEALHVNHGLQAAASAMQAHCEAQADACGVRLHCLPLHGAPARGESVEAWARHARYAAMADALSAGDVLLTAHHAGDQAEGFLLAALRGSGPDGLASAAAERPLGKAWLLRPWLGVASHRIQAWASDQGLTWFEDPMNDDARHDRVWLRQTVLPALADRRPAAMDTLARSAAHLAETADLCRALAEVDRHAVQTADGGLGIPTLRALGPARARNVLRHVLRERQWPLPDALTLQRVLDEVCRASRDAQPMVSWGGVEARRHGDRLFLLLAAAPVPDQWTAHWTGGALTLPAALGSLHSRATGDWQVRLPRPGDAVSQDRRPRKSWRRWCQEAGVPVWLRDRVPLVLSHGAICAAGGVVIQADTAPRGLHWHNAPPADDGLAVPA